MKVKLIVGLIIVLGAVGLFFLSSAGGSKPVYYYSPSQIITEPALQHNRLRLEGIIKPGATKMSRDKMDLYFTVSDKKHGIRVHYHGAIPDAFQDGLQVVVDGRMGPKGIFEGKELIVKCPSKYQSESAPRGQKGPVESKE